MKIKYLGTPGEDHEAIAMYGYVFPKGKAVEVSDPLAMRKLANHPHFSSNEEPPPEGNPEALKKVEQAAHLLEEAAVIEQKDADKAEAQTIANLTDEEKYGNDERAGDANAAKTAGDSSERGPRRTGPSKSR